MSKTFTIERVRHEDKATIDEVYKLMQKIFGAEELDPKKIFVASIRGGYPIIQRVYAAKDGKKVVGMCAGGIDSLDQDNLILMVSYAATEESHRRQGIQRELFRRMLEDGQREAFEEDRRIAIVSSEASRESELFWNSVGLNRLYVPIDDEEIKYKELPYIQPAVDFDATTGLPTEDGGEVAEHLMLGFIETEATPELVSKSVDAIYRWSSRWPRSDFKSDEAYASHLKYSSDIQRTFDEFVHQSEIVVGMTAAEREKLKAEGGKVFEHVDADKTDEE